MESLPTLFAVAGRCALTLGCNGWRNPGSYSSTGRCDRDILYAIVMGCGHVGCGGVSGPVTDAARGCGGELRLDRAGDIAAGGMEVVSSRCEAGKNDCVTTTACRRCDRGQCCRNEVDLCRCKRSQIGGAHYARPVARDGCLDLGCGSATLGGGRQCAMATLTIGCIQPGAVKHGSWQCSQSRGDIGKILYSQRRGKSAHAGRIGSYASLYPRQSHGRAGLGGSRERVVAA